MSFPIISLPSIIKTQLKPYQDFFSKPQFGHFTRLVTGKIVCDNKTNQEINDEFGERDQSNLNRFVSYSTFDLEKINEKRIDHAKENHNLTKKGIQIIDESLLHKTGKSMELAGTHRSGVTKRLEWGHMVVNSYYIDMKNNSFPIKTDVYVKEDCCKKNNLIFKTKREIGIEQIDFALKNKLPIKTVLVDAGYEGEDFTREISDRKLNYIIGIRNTTKFSINRRKRIDSDEYMSTLDDTDFNVFFKNNEAYFYHIKLCSIRCIGTVKIIFTYKYGDEENIKIYITNLKLSDKIIISMLIKRWEIECFHRDAKQHLGLESYQVRKSRGMQVVALATLTAYTLVKIVANQIVTPVRKLKTVGEVCRYLSLIAHKGTNWFNALMKKPDKFAKMLKKHVFVKNAKV
jgi:SRSO17 transposase